MNDTPYVQSPEWKERALKAERELTQLRANNYRLRERLRDTSDCLEAFEQDGTNDAPTFWPSSVRKDRVLQKNRKALEETK